MDRYDYSTAMAAWQEHAASWQFFVTLTTRVTVTGDQFDGLLRSWVRSSARFAPGSHLYALLATDRRGLSHRLHAHAAVAPADRLTPLPVDFKHRLAGAWSALGRRAGRSDIRPVSEAIGALRYIALHHVVGLGFACGRTGACAHRACTRGPSFFLDSSGAY